MFYKILELHFAIVYTFSMTKPKDIGKNLIELIRKKGFTQARLAKEAGLTSRQVWNIVHGKHRDIKYETLQKIANALGVKIADITGESEEIEREKEYIEIQKEKIKRFLDQITAIETSAKEITRQLIPIYGRIPAGYPVVKFDDIPVEDYIRIPGVPKDAFALIVSGDSMTDAGIEDGDIVVLVPPTQEPLDGKVVAVRIDMSEVTLKRYYANRDYIMLVPANRKYKPLIFTTEQAEEQVELIGIVKKVVKDVL